MGLKDKRISSSIISGETMKLADIHDIHILSCIITCSSFYSFYRISLAKVLFCSLHLLTSLDCLQRLSFGCFGYFFECIKPHNLHHAESMGLSSRPFSHIFVRRLLPKSSPGHSAQRSYWEPSPRATQQTLHFCAESRHPSVFPTINSTTQPTPCQERPVLPTSIT